jgi:putative MATE family efflux protein
MSSPSSAPSEPAAQAHVPEALSDEPLIAIIWRLAWPAIALNALQVVNSLLDRFFIGNYSAASLTAQISGMNVMFVVASIALGISTAATALVARFYGARQHADLQAAARQCLNFALLSGIVASLATILLARPAAYAMLPPPKRPQDFEAIEIMVRYVTVYGYGVLAVFISQTLAGAMRGVGDTRSPMILSGVQIVLHMALNCLLVFPASQGVVHFAFNGIQYRVGAGLGLMGAGIALSASTWISSIAYLAYAGRTRIGPVWRMRLPDSAWIRRILNISNPATANQLFRVLSQATFNFILARLPDSAVAAEAIAGMGVCFAIEQIMIMPAYGIGAAAATLVGQSLGGQRPDRAERYGWLCGAGGFIITGLLAIFLYFVGPTLFGWIITRDPLAIPYGVWLLRGFCLVEALYALAMVLFAAMQGAGDTRRPTVITIACLWGMRIPAGFLLALPLGFGAYGAFLAMVVSQGIQGIFAFFAFKGGKWKTMKV